MMIATRSLVKAKIQQWWDFNPTLINDTRKFQKSIHSLPRSTRDFNQALDGLIERKEFAAAISLFRQEKMAVNADFHTWEMMLLCSTQQGKLRDAMGIMGKILKLGKKLDKTAYLGMLTLMMKNGMTKDTNNCYNEMVNGGLLPDARISKIMLEAYCKTGNLEAATKIFRHCDHETICYNMLINCCFKRKANDIALRLFFKMRMMGVEPSVVTYNTLLNGFYKTQNVKVANKLLKEMASQGVLLSESTHRIILDGLCRNGQYERALELFKDWENETMSFDIQSITIMIEGMFKFNKLNVAFDLFRGIPIKGLKTDLQVYDVMVYGLCKKGLISQAKMVVGKLTQNGFSPSGCTYNPWIRAHLRNGSIPEAIRLIKLLKSSGLAPEDHTIKMIKRMKSEGKLSESDFDTMKELLGL